MLRKVAYAGSQSASFVQATKDLIALAETKVSREHMAAIDPEQILEKSAWRKQNDKPKRIKRCRFPEQQKSPTDQLPQVVCVMMDGGRIQVRDRHENEPNTQGYWKESLVGCCLSMVSEEQLRDPCPTIPKTFVDPQRMHDLSREIKGSSASTEGAAALSAEFPAIATAAPEVLVRSVVATRGGQVVFGKRLVAKAHSRGFHAARRKAFVADGSASNWTVHRKFFSHYTPIVDFTHAICYVYAAAMAGRSGPAAWDDYVCWAQWL